jgi:hypothetical protein
LSKLDVGTNGHVPSYLIGTCTDGTVLGAVSTSLSYDTAPVSLFTMKTTTITVNIINGVILDDLIVGTNDIGNHVSFLSVMHSYTCPNGEYLAGYQTLASNVYPKYFTGISFFCQTLIPSGAGDGTGNDNIGTSQCANSAYGDGSTTATPGWSSFAATGSSCDPTNPNFGDSYFPISSPNESYSMSCRRGIERIRRGHE